MERQDKYEPIVVNLSRTEVVRHPRNYLAAFIISLLLLGVVGGFAAYYLRNRPWETPPLTPTPQAPMTQETVAQATTPERPTPMPTATATPPPKSTPTPRPSPKPTTAAVPVPKTPAATATPTPIVSGYVTLRSAPPNAEVLLNRKRIGQTPLESYELAPGIYDVTFTFDGQAHRETLRIVAGETTTYTHIFQGFGALTIQTTTSNCDVSLNGRAVGKSPLTVEGLSAGEYTVVVSKVGYHTVEKIVTLAQEERQELFLTIKRLGSRPGDTPIDPNRPIHPSERQE